MKIDTKLHLQLVTRTGRVGSQHFTEAGAEAPIIWSAEGDDEPVHAVVTLYEQSGSGTIALASERISIEHLRRIEAAGSSMAEVVRFMLHPTHRITLADALQAAEQGIDQHDDEQQSAEAAALAKKERDRKALSDKRAAQRSSGKKSRTYWVWPEDTENVDRYIERLNRRRAAARTKEGLPT